MAQFVDWDLAAATAAALGKSGPAVSYEEAAAAVTDLRGLADEATEHVSSFTGLRTKLLAPPVRIVDRRDWAATNIEGLRQVIQPLAERLSGGKQPGPVAGAIGSRFTGVQAGTVLAYLSGKVLGQYEVFSADPGQLLLVAPNIVEAERKLGADPRDFRLWVCLHEVTHRVQFTAVPWMRGYFLGEVGAFVDASQLNQDQLAERLRRGVGALADAVRNPDSRASVLDLVQTPGQKAVLDRLTALMTVLEGHAEFVMDGVGPEVVPTVEDIRAKFNRRREAANPLDRVLRKLLGVDVKLRQYAEGRKFVHAVVERVGMEGFNKIWQSPLTIPRIDELGDPEAWIVRVLGASALTRPVPVPMPPAPVPTVPEPAAETPAEAGIAAPAEVAGLTEAAPVPGVDAEPTAAERAARTEAVPLPGVPASASGTESDVVSLPGVPASTAGVAGAAGGVAAGAAGVGSVQSAGETSAEAGVAAPTEVAGLTEPVRSESTLAERAAQTEAIPLPGVPSSGSDTEPAEATTVEPGVDGASVGSDVDGVSVGSGVGGASAGAGVDGASVGSDVGDAPAGSEVKAAAVGSDVEGASAGSEVDSEAVGSASVGSDVEGASAEVEPVAAVEVEPATEVGAADGAKPVGDGHSTEGEGSEVAVGEQPPEPVDMFQSDEVRAVREGHSDSAGDKPARSGDAG